MSQLVMDEHHVSSTLQGFEMFGWKSPEVTFSRLTWQPLVNFGTSGLPVILLQRSTVLVDLRSTVHNYFGSSGFESFLLFSRSYNPLKCRISEVRDLPPRVLLFWTTEIHFGSSGFGAFSMHSSYNPLSVVFPE
jgi:hypothetical protein